MNRFNFSLRAYHLLIVLPLFIFFQEVHTQTLIPDLTIATGGEGRDDFSRFTFDYEGNLYCVGIYASDPYFNNSVVTTYGSRNIILSKYDVTGSLIWAKTIAHGLSLIPNSITWHNEKLCISGSFRGSLIFMQNQEGTTDTLVSIGFFDAFISEFHTDGTLINKKGFKNMNEITGMKYIDQNIVIAGTFDNYIEFNRENPTQLSSIYSAGSTDIFIACLDKNLNFLWGKRAGGADIDNLYGTYFYNEDIYITGSFVNNMNFNTPSSESCNLLTAYGYGDIFVAKYDKYGNPHWIKRAGSSYDENNGYESSETGCGIFINKHGVYVVGTGSFQSHFNGPQDTNYTIFNNSDYSNTHFLAHYAHNGTIKWVKELHTTNVYYPPLIHGTDHYIGITESFRNTFAAYSSYYEDSIRFTARGSFDYFTRLFDFEGNFITGASLGSAKFESVFNLFVSNNQIYLSGSFEDVCHFNDGQTSVSQIGSRGLEDIFIARYPFPEFIVDTVEIPDYSLKLYPNPAEHHITITNTTDQIGLRFFMFDIMGKIVFQGELTQNENIVNISDLNAGLYFVQILTNKPSTLKFVKY